MNKILFLALLVVATLAGGKAWGQTLDAYSFSTGTGGTTYTPTFTQIIASGKDDEVSSVTDIGFTFKYDGVEYTKFSANSNGRIRLGSTAITTEYNPPFTNTSEIYKGNPPKIVAVGRDCSTGNAGYVKTGLYGSSGSYVRVIEFKLHNTSASSGTTYVRFQIQLFEGTNEIRFVYFEYSNAPSTYQIGIGNANYNKFWYVNPSSHSASYSTTYTSATYNVHPGVGRYYSFRPPYVTPSATAVCAGSSYTIKANGGSTYQWQYKTSGGSWTNLGTFSSSAAAPIYNSYSGGKSQTLNVTAHSNIEIALQWRCYINNSYYTDPVTINVYSAPSAGTISGTTPINVGNSAQFTVTGNSTTGSWSSGNSNYLTVTSSGLVSAVAAGSTSIYYTVSKPSAPSGCNSAQASYAVTVPSCSSVNPPTNIQATAVYQGVNLSWDAAENASSYIVYYGTNGNYNLNKAASGTTCSITGLTQGTQYNFKVMSVGDGTTYCENNTLSSAVTATPLDRTVSVSGSTVCSGNGTTLTATATGFGNTAKYSWSASPSSGAGLPQNCTNLTSNTITVAPTEGGNYTYTCTVTEEVGSGSQYEINDVVYVDANTAEIAASGLSCKVIKTTANTITVFYEETAGGDMYEGSAPSASRDWSDGESNTDYMLTIATSGNSNRVYGFSASRELGWYIPSCEELLEAYNAGFRTSSLFITSTFFDNADSYRFKTINLSNGAVDRSAGGRYSKAKKFTVSGTASASASVTLNIPQSPTITGLSDDAICAGEAISLTATVGDENCGSSIYSWKHDGSSVGGNSITYSKTPSVAADAGQYTFSVTVVAFKQYDLITIDGVQAIVVVAPTATQTGKAVPIENGVDVPDARSAGNIADNAATYLQEAIKVNGGTTYSGNREGYKIPAGAEGGVCSSTATVEIAVNALPTPSITQANNYTELTCSRTSITLAVSGVGAGATYSWTGGGTNSTNNYSSAGSYSVTVTENGCSAASSSYQITSNTTAPSVSISGNNSVCAGVSTTLSTTSNAGYTYSWSNEGTTNSITVTPMETTSYNVTVTNTGNGCTAKQDGYQVSVSTPTVAGIASGDFVWCGKESTAWNTTGNWLTYNGTRYAVASGTAKPTTSTNVFIVDYDNCVSRNPSLGGNSYAKNLTIGDGKTLNVNSRNLTVTGNVLINSSSSLTCTSGTINVAGNFTKNGSFTRGTGTVNFNGTSVVAGSPIFNNVVITGTMSNSASIDVRGNWTNNGTFTPSLTKAVVFNGTAVQNVNGSEQTNFGKVTFNNSNGFVVETEPVISGLATLTDGILTGDVTFASGSSVSGASVNSFVNGTVTLIGNGSNFTFPTGAVSEDAKIIGTLTASVASGHQVSVTYHNASMQETVINGQTHYGYTLDDGYPRWWNADDMCGEVRFSNVSNFEYWSINTPDALTATLSSTGTTSEVHYGTNNYTPEEIAASVQCAMYGNDCWSSKGGTASMSADKKTLTVTGASLPATTRSGSFTTFGSLTRDIILPIELISFTAECDNSRVLVSWTTATEINNDYFVLERSYDAVTFIEVARILGAGNSTEPIDYSYTDTNIYSGDNYYRLIQVDYNGTRTVSEVITINCVDGVVANVIANANVVAYPNPFNNDITLRLENFENMPTQIEIFDMLGKLIRIEKVASPHNDYEMVLDLGYLAPAAYNIRVSTKDFVIVKQIVKQ